MTPTAARARGHVASSVRRATAELVNTGQTRDGSLDGIRAMAALGIVVFHAMTLYLPGHRTRGVLDSVVNHLDVGVPLFFVLSGFLIYTPFVTAASRDQHVSLRSYAWRRGLRLLPAYWLALWFTFGWQHPLRLFTGGGLRYTFLLQIYTNHDVFRGLGPAWSLCSEISFYIALPLLAVVLADRMRRSPGRQILCLVALGLISILARGLWDDTGARNVASSVLPTTFLWFSLGMILAVSRNWRSGPLVRAFSGPPWRSLAAAVVVFAVACAVLPPAKVAHGTGLDLLRYVLFGAVGLLIVGPMVLRDRSRPSLAARVFGSRVLVALGLSSYGIYLWNMLILGKLSSLFPSLAHNAHSYSPAQIAFVVLACLLSIAAGLASFVVIEGPLQRFAHRRWPWRVSTIGGAPPPIAGASGVASPAVVAASGD